MSRTYKGEKGPGYEYWGRKYNSDGKCLTKPGSFTKKHVNKRERRKINEQLRNDRNFEKDY